MKLIFQSKTKLGELFSVIINTCLIRSPSKSVEPSFIVRKRHIFQDRHGRTGSHRWILVHASDLLVSLVFFYPCDIFSIDQDLSGFYRKTPLGREIADLLLAVNRPYGKSDYIPCICWGRNARYASGFEVGEHVQLLGRIQSREYVKRISDTETEKRIAYEVSVSKLEKTLIDSACI